MTCEQCKEEPGLCGDCYGQKLSQAIEAATGEKLCCHPLYHDGKVFAVCTLPHGVEHDHGIIKYL